MADPAIVEIDVTLLETSGPTFTVGVPRVLCRFSAAHAPGSLIDDGTVCVLARNRETHECLEYERPTMLEHARAVVAAVQALGIPGRAPDVTGTVDTSDWSTRLVIRIRSEPDTTTIDLAMQSSGFQGADAEALRSLCRYLFALAGFDGYDWSIYGSRAASLTPNARESVETP